SLNSLTSIHVDNMTSKGAALVTGAGNGIGRAIALRLAKDGYNIALNDIDSGALDKVKKEIQEMGTEVIIYIGDVSKETAVVEMIDFTTEKLGGLDVMVANAGIFVAKPFLDCTLEDWDKLFDINGKGVFLCYKYAAKKMIEQGRGGRIIGACSRAGKRGLPLSSIYCATKFAVRSLTQSVALALKPHGITVNAYAPGLIDTPLGAKVKDGYESLGSSFNEVPGTPEDIAGLVSYLASKEAAYVTGQSININGGTYFD
ncbi:Diacetyl reductase [(S)-acetoin forming], partial [Leucoagaricus sp. SymC.cos]